MGLRHYDTLGVDMTLRTSNSRNRYIRFRDHNGGYQSVKCGKLGYQDSELALCHIRHLVRIRVKGRQCRESTLDWLNGEGQKIAVQLLRVGLVKICV